MTEKIQKALHLAKEAISYRLGNSIHSFDADKADDQDHEALAAIREAKEELEAVKKKMIEDSWALYPDRMGQ